LSKLGYDYRSSAQIVEVMQKLRDLRRKEGRPIEFPDTKGRDPHKTTTKVIKGEANIRRHLKK
jgi:hypothetical protein